MGIRISVDGDHWPDKERYQVSQGKSWMEGREYRHYSGDCQPKDNSPILYNRHEVDNWVERQQPAKTRAKRRNPAD